MKIHLNVVADATLQLALDTIVEVNGTEYKNSQALKIAIRDLKKWADFLTHKWAIDGDGTRKVIAYPIVVSITVQPGELVTKQFYSNYNMFLYNVQDYIDNLEIEE